MKYTQARSFISRIFMTLTLFTASISLTNQSSEPGLNSINECEAFENCRITHGSGTRQEGQELIHDTRSAFTLNVTCSTLLKRSIDNVTISLHFGDTVYLADSLQGGCTHFHLQLDPWKWGLLMITTAGGCVVYQRYLVTGYPPDVHISWTCSVAADTSDGGKNDGSSSCSTSPSSRRSEEDRSHSIICRYAAKQLRSLAAAGRPAAKELALSVKAELGVAAGAVFKDPAIVTDAHLSDSATSAQLIGSESSSSTNMTCDEPDAAAEGRCWACWRPNSAKEVQNSRHVASLAVTNLLGAASTRQLFVTVDAVILGKPKATIQDGFPKANSVTFLFYPTKEPERLHLCFWNKSVEYTVLVQLSGVASEELTSADTVKRPLSLLAVQTCAITCCQETGTEEYERNALCKYCAVTVGHLAPAKEYSYQAAWRLQLEGDMDGAGRWSEPSVGTFLTAESAPSAAPSVAQGGFEYRVCANSCDATLGGSPASCVSLTVFWRDIAPEQKNGRLTAFGVRVFSGHAREHVARVPSSRRSYTICYESHWNLLVELTAETAAGQSPTSIMIIDGSSSLLPPVSNVVARHNEPNTVDLWWSYTEPVERFVLLWRAHNDPLSVLNWTTLDAAALQPTWRSGEKWHYTFRADHMGNISFGQGIVYGVGALYRGRHSGLTFNAQCPTYAGEKAPAAEVYAQQSTLSSTSIQLHIRVLWDDAGRCSFAGPLKGFELKVTDDGSNVTHEATCQGCVNYSGTAFENPENSFSIQVKDLVPNHSYLIAVRTVVDAGAAEVSGPYSTVVRARTSGLKIPEAVGVAIASLIVCGVLLLVTLLALQCHRAIGFGQKVNVRTIKPAKRDSMNPDFTGSLKSVRDFDYKIAHSPVSRRTLNDVSNDDAESGTADSTVLLEFSDHGSNHFNSSSSCWQPPHCREVAARDFSQSRAALMVDHPDFSSLHILMAEDRMADSLCRFEDNDESFTPEDITQWNVSPSNTDSQYVLADIRSYDCIPQSANSEQMSVASENSSIRELKVELVDSSTRQTSSSDLGYWQLNEVGELASEPPLAEHCIDRCTLQPLQP